MIPVDQRGTRLRELCLRSLLGIGGGFLLAACVGAGNAMAAVPGQQTIATQPTQPSAGQAGSNASTSNPSATAQQAKTPRASDRRRAVKLYLTASKLFEAEKFEDAMEDYQKAAELDPGTQTIAWRLSSRGAIR